MEEVRDRIKKLIEHTGLSNKDFAERLHINPAIISHILSGRNNPSLHVIQQITNVYTNVNIDYLLNGRGDLFIAESLPPSSNLNHNEAIRTVAPPDSTPLSAPQQSSPPPPPIPARESLKTNVNYKSASKNEGEKKEIERVIIFYSDKSIEEYRP